MLWGTIGQRYAMNGNTLQPDAIIYDIFLFMKPCEALMRARVLADETQLSLAMKLAIRFPSRYSKEKVSHQMISNLECNPEWEPTPATWIRLREVLSSLPPLGTEQ